MAIGNPDWTKEEVLLAMDLYVSSGAIGGGPIPGKGSPAVTALSAVLKKLSAHPLAKQSPTFRNADGVYLKLTNLRSIESGGAHGMSRYSQLDAATWREYIDDLPRLKAEAEAIRRCVEEGFLGPASSAPVVTDVPIEKQHTEWFFVHPSGQPRQAERSEQKLVVRYRDWLKAQGVGVMRRKYVPAGEVRPLFCDVWVPDWNLLVEAKNSDSREAIRYAIGQLYDYRRFHTQEPSLAVLTPYKPVGDRMSLLQAAGIGSVWPHGDGFRGTSEWVS